MSKNTQLKRWSVLLVEDEAGTRGVLAKHLGRVGLDVTAVEAAEDVPGARERLGRPFDVVVSDVHLPGMSGIELATMLLASFPGQPIVLITGDPDAALRREALSRGPVSYLLKPFDLAELESAVREALAGDARRRLTPPPSLKKVEPRVGGIPADWLKWVDERSYAGAGHGVRVARLCRVLVGDRQQDDPLSKLQLASYGHEVGLMAGAASDPVELAWRGADTIAGLGGDPEVVRVIRHMHERWDGSGGPEKLAGASIPAGSAVLSVADSLDHYAGAWMQVGVPTVDAVDRAIELVLAQSGSAFNPELMEVVSGSRAAILAICEGKRPAPVDALTGRALHRNAFPAVLEAALSTES